MKLLRSFPMELFSLLPLTFLDSNYLSMVIVLDYTTSQLLKKIFCNNSPNMQHLSFLQPKEVDLVSLLLDN